MIGHVMWPLLYGSLAIGLGLGIARTFVDRMTLPLDRALAVGCVLCLVISLACLGGCALLHGSIALEGVITASLMMHFGLLFTLVWRSQRADDCAVE